MDSLSTHHKLFPWVTGALMASILVIPGALVLLTVWLSLYGLWNIKGFSSRIWHPSIQMGAGAIWLGLLVYVVFGISIGLWHGYSASYFEAYPPMLLAPLVLNAIVVAQPPKAMLWMGAACAAILAGFVAAYQSLYLNIGRAIGAMNNQIVFGDLAVVMGAFAGFGLIYWGRFQGKLWIKGVLSLGVAMGLLASLLSGTKGGWLSILMIAFVFVWLAYPHWHWGKRLCAAGFVLAAIVGVAFLLPSDLVVNRVANGLQGGAIWFSTGQVTEGSVSIRLEIWSQALTMIADRPFAGWSMDSEQELGKRLANAGAIVPSLQAEHDLLQAGIVHGLPAIASYLALYLGFIFAFARIRRMWISNVLWVGLSTAGIVLVVLMLEFGLSVVVLGRQGFRHTFMVWAMVLLGYLLLLWQQRQLMEAQK